MKLLSLLALVLAQSLPLTVKIGITPDTSASAPMGYTISLDGAPPIDVGKPSTDPACKDFVGSANAPCIPLSVSITTAGSHTVSIAGYNLGGPGPATAITFSVTAAPGSGNLRLVK